MKYALRVGVAVLGSVLCSFACSRLAAAQPMANEPGHWKQSIERPSRKWDYDGQRILGRIGHDICLWDATTGKRLQTMKSHKEHIHAVQFSPDGIHALSSSWMGEGPMVWYVSKDTSTVLWDLTTGRPSHIFAGQVAGEFSPTGSRLVTFSRLAVKAERFDATVWDTATGRQLATAKLEEYCHPNSDALHFTPDGSRFAYVDNGGFLLYNSSGGMLFNVRDGREIGRIDRNDVKFGNGHRYTSSGALATIEPTRARLIDFTSGREVRSMEHDLQHIWGTIWTHDGSQFAAIPFEGRELKIGNIETGKITTGAKTHPGNPNYAIVSPDGSRLAIKSGSNLEDNPEVRLYHMRTGEEFAKIKLGEWAEMVGFSPDGKTLLVGGPKFVIYDAANGKLIRTHHLLDDASDWDN